MEPIDVYEPGDKVWTMSNDGRVCVWQVLADGSLMEAGR